MGMNAKPSKSRPLVVFAQVPPPEHGQNRMVKRMLDILREDGGIEVIHINASFSHTLDEVGRGSIIKLLRGFRYLAQAIVIRFRVRDPVLYYIPGPLKWSAVTRDWMILGILRIFYPRVVFHWHAIGQGEWAHGSKRLRISGPPWFMPLARAWSRFVLRRPQLSMVVSPTSRRDADAIRSKRVEVVPNGCDGPDEEFLAAAIASRKQRDLNHVQRWLFLSRGNEEKGLTDLMQAMALIEPASIQPDIELILAGGVTQETRESFDDLSTRAKQVWKERLKIREVGFVSGADKWEAYAQADLFIAPSRWESFGLVATEAMAMDLPVVASDCDGLRGILPDDYPLISNTSDPESLRDALKSACALLCSGADAELRTMLRERHHAHFRLAAFGCNVTQALKSVTTDEAIPGSFDRLNIATYLADQNPKLGRSLGISRMTEVVLETLSQRSDVSILPIVSSSSIQGPRGCEAVKRMPWSTKNSLVRIMTDNLHPALIARSRRPDVWFYPKGFMPRLPGLCRPAVAMIHDTIIQFYQDKYPEWRTATEYGYWASMLRQTLAHASEVMTVSQHSKKQIESFIRRHHLPEREIHVTYEPCSYESVPQPESPAKADHILHLASREPHKQTAWLVDLWIRESRGGRSLPKLHVVGTLPDEIREAAEHCSAVAHFPFLEDPALISQFMSAKALIFPSEIEGFGLPAIEAYYLGTPVCYTQGTSMEEILKPATDKGCFDLNDVASFWAALDSCLRMSPEEIRKVGLQLRQTYAAATVAKRIMAVFRTAAGHEQHGIKIAS